MIELTKEESKLYEEGRIPYLFTFMENKVLICHKVYGIDNLRIEKIDGKYYVVYKVLDGKLD